MADPKWDETEDILEAPKFEDTEEIEQPSQLEAVARGAGQGLTFGFLDELMAAFKASGGASPRQIVESPKEAIAKEKEMLRSYAEEIGKEREATAAAKEAFPVTATTSEIVGGIIPALLTGGTSAAGSVARGGLKGLGQAAKTGLIQSAIYGAGTSEAETPLELAKDIAVSGAIGAGTGAVLPKVTQVGGSAVGKAKRAVKEVADLIPGIEASKVGFKAGKQGIKLTSEGAREAIKDYSEKLHKTVVKKLTKEGLDKKKAIELADEMGIRINAGEPVENMMDKMVQEGAIGLKDAKEKAAFFSVLDDLKTGNDQTIKAIKKLEAKTAKQVAKDKYAFGAEARTSKTTEDTLEELIPLPEQEGRILGLQTKMRVPSKEGQEPIEYMINNFQEILDNPVKLKNIDIKNLKPSEAEEMIQYVNSFAGDLSKPAQNITQKKARELALNIRDLSNQALESAAVSEKNKSITNLYRALKRLGIKDRLRGSEEALKEQIDSIRKKIAASGEGAEIDKERAFEYLSKVGSEFKDIAEQGKFLGDVSKLAGMTEAGRTVSAKGLIGTAEGAVGKISNIAGRVARNVSQKAQPVTSRASKVANKIVDFTDNQLVGASERLINSQSPAIKSMGQQLQYALQQEGPIKNSAIWALSQNPAFRKTIQNAIGDMEKGMGEDLEFQPTELDKTLFPPSENKREPQSVGTIESEPMMSIGEPAQISQSQNVDVKRSPSSIEEIDQKFILGQEGFETEGYVPVKGEGSNYTATSGSGEIAGNSGVTIASGLDLGQRNNLNDLNLPESIKQKLTPYLGLKREEAVNKLKELPLSLTKEEALIVKNATEKAYYDLTKRQFEKNSFGKKFDELPAEVQTALYSLVYNTGSIGPETLKKASNDEDYTDLIQELKNYYPKGSKADLEFQGQRRRAEAEYIENIQKAKDREFKQLGSGATPGANRSSLEDLMGKFNSMRGIVAENQINEMEDSAMSGDMGRLQELIDRLRMA